MTTLGLILHFGGFTTRYMKSTMFILCFKKWMEVKVCIVVCLCGYIHMCLNLTAVEVTFCAVCVFSLCTRSF